MIKPRRGIVLIKIVEEEKQKGGIYLGKAQGTNFNKAVILEVGPDVKDLKKGEAVYVHYGRWESLEIGGKEAFISQEDIFAKIEDEPLETN